MVWRIALRRCAAQRRTDLDGLRADGAKRRLLSTRFDSQRRRRRRRHRRRRGDFGEKNPPDPLKKPHSTIG